jgi:ribonuclease HIII
VNESKLQTNIYALREFIHNNGWSIIDEKEIQSGYQLVVTDGITRVPVALFHSGKALIQGKPGELQTKLKTWHNERKSASTQSTASIARQSSLIELPTTSSTETFTGKARIGLDESGKGDYYGPLVIGAVFVDAQTEDKLIALGVRDSKLLTDSRMLPMAEEIKVLCPNFVVPIEPKRYNELYAKVKNSNRLLAWGHAWSLENMLEKVSSILARARFVQQMERLSSQIGKTLPKGASDPSIVTIGRELVAEHGKDRVMEIAKLHFKTTEVILQS